MKRSSTTAFAERAESSLRTKTACSWVSERRSLLVSRRTVSIFWTRRLHELRPRIPLSRLRRIWNSWFFRHSMVCDAQSKKRSGIDYWIDNRLPLVTTPIGERRSFQSSHYRYCHTIDTMVVVELLSECQGNAQGMLVNFRP